MADLPRLIVQVPRGGAVDRQLRAQTLPSIASGEVVIQALGADPEGTLEAPGSGETVLSVPSLDALEREADSVRRVIGRAGTGVQPILVVVDAAQELRDEQLRVVVEASGHTSRAVILRIIRDP